MKMLTLILLCLQLTACAHEYATQQEYNDHLERQAYWQNQMNAARPTYCTTTKIGYQSYTTCR